MEYRFDNDTNREYVQRLRTFLAEDDTPVFIFLRAGLSFGVDRGKVMFERDEFEDNRRFPSWPQLLKRMQKFLLSDPVLESFKDSVDRFFEKECIGLCRVVSELYPGAKLLGLLTMPVWIQVR